MVFFDSIFRSGTTAEKEEKFLKAAEAGATKDVESLLRAGVRVDCKTSSQATALHLASKAGHVSTISALLSKGAPLHYKDSAGWNPFHCAAAADKPEAIAALVAACATSRPSGARAIVQGLLSTKDLKSRTPLHLAALHGPTTVRALVEAGAPLDAVDEKGRTALMSVAAGGSVDLVKLLVGEGVERGQKEPWSERAKATVGMCDAEGNSAYTLAAEESLADVLRELDKVAIDL